MYNWRTPQEHAATALRVIEWMKRRRARQQAGVYPTPFADRMKREEQAALPSPLTWMEGMNRSWRR